MHLIDTICKRQTLKTIEHGYQMKKRKKNRSKFKIYKIVSDEQTLAKQDLTIYGGKHGVLMQVRTYPELYTARAVLVSLTLLFT